MLKIAACQRKNTTEKLEYICFYFTLLLYLRKIQIIQQNIADLAIQISLLLNRLSVLQFLSCKIKQFHNLFQLFVIRPILHEAFGNS